MLIWNIKTVEWEKKLETAKMPSTADIILESKSHIFLVTDLLTILFERRDRVKQSIAFAIF